MFLRIALAAFLSASAATAATTGDDLRALEETRRDAIARQDFDVLRRIYAPEFVAIAGNGAVIDRNHLFGLFRAVDRSLAFSVDDIRVIELGDTALFVGRLVARSGERIVSSARFSHTFVRKNGQWQCVFGQSTPVPDVPGSTSQEKR
jgi:ketosteroid isomerase-like protein